MTTSVDNSMTQPQINALNQVYGRALVMVQTLAAMRQGFSSRIPAVRQFQQSWNANLGALRAWAVDGVVSNIAAETLATGLDEDGRYGPRTAHALGELIWLIGEDFDNVVGDLPVAAANIPLWYAQYHTLIEGALTTDFKSPLPDDAPVNLDPNGQSSLENTDGGVEDVLNNEVVADDIAPEHVFEDDRIVSTARRTTWSVPIWAIGLGLATAAGLFFFVAKKKKDER